ncbi:hypothetical protein [Microvirga calopogonii]|uniref:hypothetical protein n=1 Tax=Microvirga calopogonii TaxID=2078013 RepID=UPI0013B471A3|nr:hypothetical protein [Microvirga calopogonii]
MKDVWMPLPIVSEAIHQARAGFRSFGRPHGNVPEPAGQLVVCLTTLPASPKSKEIIITAASHGGKTLLEDECALPDRTCQNLYVAIQDMPQLQRLNSISSIQ